MLRNDLKIALRHLWRLKGYTALNVGGLAVGMAACLLIGLYVQDELSYDTFHPQADRIFAFTVTIETNFFEETRRITPYPLGEALASEVPGIQRVTRTWGTGNETTVHYEAGKRRLSRQQRVLEADAAFFDVFAGFRMKRGRVRSALDAPDEAVITASMAQAFFGDSDPIGRSLTVEDDTLRRYTVVGVTEVPANSTLQFDMVVPMPDVAPRQRQWGTHIFHTYARAADGGTPRRIEQAVEAAVPSKAERYVSAVGALPLPELYLSSVYDADGFRGRPRYLYIFGTIALLILLIAAINYVNLVTAQAERRAREVGVRKTMGASRQHVAYQFLGEALLLSGMALAVALGLVAGALPAFNALFDKTLSLSTARHGWAVLNGAGVVGIVSLLAGVYPAVIVSGFAPARILRGASATTAGSGGWLRRGLVGMQFAASVGLILATTIIYQQLNYVQTKDLGFDGEQVVTVDLDDVPENQRRLVRRKVLRGSNVEHATLGSFAPGRGMQVLSPSTPEELSPQAQTSGDKLLLRPIQVGTNYVETLGLRVLAGRSFANSTPGERDRGYILNQAAVDALGWSDEEAVGMPFRLPQNSEGPGGEVIGVVENFHLGSLHSPIAPVVLAPQLESSSENMLAARLAPNDISAGVDHLRNVMNGIAPQAEFSYTFLDDKFDAMYRSEKRLARIFAAFAIIAVVVACMGLFGLAAFAVRRRTKEIGIRKALGATAASIVGLLSKEYAVLLAVAFVVGAPAAYTGMQRWLQNFAYRVDVGVGPFVWTAGLAVLVAGLTVSVHAFRAARVDPARTLRDE